MPLLAFQAVRFRLKRMLGTIRNGKVIGWYSGKEERRESKNLQELKHGNVFKHFWHKIVTHFEAPPSCSSVGKFVNFVDDSADGSSVCFWWQEFCRSKGIGIFKLQQELFRLFTKRADLCQHDDRILHMHILQWEIVRIELFLKIFYKTTWILVSFCFLDVVWTLLTE